MSTEKRIIANRRNAQKSTGPKTPEGKARSRLNALKHGLLAKDVVLHDEKDEDFVAMLEAFYEDCQPVGHLEESLVRHLAIAEWRLNRLTRAEAGLFWERMRQVRDSEPEDTPRGSDEHDEISRLLGAALLQDVSGNNAFALLIRYENFIRRSWFRALQMLERTQARRHDRQPPAPAPAPEPDHPAEINPPPVNQLQENYETNPTAVAAREEPGTAPPCSLHAACSTMAGEQTAQPEDNRERTCHSQALSRRCSRGDGAGHTHRPGLHRQARPAGRQAGPLGTLPRMAQIRRNR